MIIIISSSSSSVIPETHDAAIYNLISTSHRVRNKMYTKQTLWAQKAQSFAKASDLNEKSFQVRTRISGLIPYLDPDLCRITPKMLWIRYLVGISHFAECRENLRNANKSP